MPPSSDLGPPPQPSPTRARLSSSDIDRQFEARLRSLSPPAAVSVYLPAPRADELQQRLERLTAAGSRDERPINGAELERRLKRLQGDDEPATSLNDGAAAPYAPMPVSASDVDELDVLLSQVQDEVQLDYKQMDDTATQLGRPLDGSDGPHRQKRGAERTRDRGHMEGKEADGDSVDADDAERLMEELQRMPGTEIVKLKHAAGSSHHSDDEYDASDSDEYG